MGEARRRKKLLGSEYGKPLSSNSRIAICSRDETNWSTEQLELSSRPPIPELGHLKSKLASIELENWVVDQWNNLSGFRALVSREEAHQNASVMLRKLGNNFQRDLNKDKSVSFNVNPLIKIGVGINVYSWTLWAFVGDCAGSSHVTLDADEFQLSPMVQVSCD